MNKLIRTATILAITFAGIAGATDPDAAQAFRDDSDGRAFVAAAQRGDENAVRKALQKDSTLARAIDRRGMTALDWAATREHWHIFTQLLKKGAPVDRVGSDGGTVVHRVAHHDRPDMLALVIDAGGDIGTQNQWGRTPLHVAARRGCPEVARLLIEEDADLHAVTNEGWTPLHVAYRAGQPELVNVLLAAGADPEIQDKDGLLPADHLFERPAEAEIDLASLYDYQGLFDVGDNFHFKVWVENGNLMLRDFGDDVLYPIGPDAFYCKSEPWKVEFQRDGDGNVEAVDVHFLRRGVHGVKRDHPMYVGSEACKRCHAEQKSANQYVPWVRSRHAAAYWRLATRWSAVLAGFRPHFQDMENPREDDRCLLCHVTGAQDPDALFASSFDATDGIGCESCHGPGSNYMKRSVMLDHDAFLAAGGRVPDEATCTGCHRLAEHFDFAEWWPKIAHGGTAEQ
jgi:hypothetical protein